MQSSCTDCTDEAVDCLGRCINILSQAELDEITENVHRALIHPKGNELFANYLSQFPDSLECLNIYNICSEYLAQEPNQPIRGNVLEESQSLESLITKVKTVRETALTVTATDLQLMKQFNEALKIQTREALLDVLQNAKEYYQNCLRKMHERFRDYILQNRNQRA
ncbi:hypothetical protein PUN28_018120 [Cardiocondyla obscurior]